MSKIRLYGDTSGYINIKAPDVSSNTDVVIPEGGFVGQNEFTSSLDQLNSSLAEKAPISSPTFDGIVRSSAGVLDQAMQFAADGSVLTNTAARVHPAEQLLKQAVWWVDAAHSTAGGQSIRNLGWGGSALNAQAGSSASVDSNDPRFLSWDGENYVYLPGVAGNNLSVPDENALDITGDIDVRVQVALDDWTPASQPTLLAKWGNDNNNRSWDLDVTTGGALIFYWSTNGTSANSQTSSVAAGITDGTVKWVRATLDVDNGASGHDVKFFTSDDGVTWTQLGSTRTGAGVTSIFSGTAIVSAGVTQGGTGLALGKFYRAQVLDGINGKPVLDVDCSQITSGSATSFQALTGQTVTISRSTSGRKSVAVVHPVWLFGTDDFMQVPDNDLLDFGASDSFTVIMVNRVTQAGATARAVISKMSTFYETATSGWTVSHSSTVGQIFFSIADGSVGPFTPVQPFSLNTLNVMASVRDVEADRLRMSINNGAVFEAVDTTTGSLANSLPMRVGRVAGTGGTYNDFELTAAAVFRRVLTPSEINLLTSYYQGRAA
jgi:hypothetical protein